MFMEKFSFQLFIVALRFKLVEKSFLFIVVCFVPVVTVMATSEQLFFYVFT